MDSYIGRRLMIVLFVMLVSTMLILLRLQHSQITRSLQRQKEMEQHIESGVMYSNDPKVHFEGGLLLVKSGNYEDAEFSFQEAIKLKPDWAEAHYYLGFVYIKLGRRNEALQEYEILKRLDMAMAQKILDLIGE